MSFLVEDDAHETLQVALAFIDACDDGQASSSASTARSSSGSGSDSPQSDASSSPSRFTVRWRSTAATVVDPSSDTLESSAKKLQEQRMEAARTARVMKSHMEAVRRCRAKKKAEAVNLREQVAQLEAKLKQLQLMRKTENSSLHVYLQRMRGDSEDKDAAQKGDDEQLVAMVPPKAPVSLWQEMAAMQARERLQSQALNVELKAALSKHGQLAKSLEVLLMSKNASQLGLDLLRDEQKQYLYSSAVLTQEPGILVDLRRRVHEIYLEMDAFFDHPSWTSIVDSVVSSSQLKITPGYGPVVEMRMNAPLHCDFRDAGNAVWQRVMEMSTLIQTPTYYLKKQQLTNSSYQKTYNLIVEGPDGTTMELRGISYAQRFVDADCDAFIWASAMYSTKGGEIFREKGWIVASSLSNGSHNDTTALCRGYSEVFCDLQDERAQVEANPGPEAKIRRGFVLKVLNDRTRTYHEFTQNLLLREFSGFQKRSRLARLPGSNTC